MERTSRLLVLAICIGFGLAFLIANVRSWELEDADAYWNAALRLRGGAPLYFSGAPEQPDVYRYAPWFAWLWVPLTLLPKTAVMTAWSMILLAATAIAVWPALRSRTAAGIALAALCGGLLLRAASTGNAQPLLVAALTWPNPVTIAVTASLKAAPLALLAAERSWRRAAVALALTAVLVAPTLAYNLADYPAEGIVGPYPLHALFAIAGLIVAWRSRRYRWVGAAVAVIFILPRVYAYSVTYLLIPIGQIRRDGPPSE